MIENRQSITLKSQEDTTNLAVRIAAGLTSGDCLLLQGPIGAGKTHFARQLILSQLSQPEDIPSPTFTLVQTYETRLGEVWHADLYRLTAVDEVIELGLFDAFEDAVCLIEWPDRLNEFAPANALLLDFAPDPDDPDIRHVTVTWTDKKWTPRMEQILND